MDLVVEKFQGLLLNELSICEEVGSLEKLKSHLDIDQNSIVGILKSLASRQIIEVSNVESEAFELSPEGKVVQELGSHEVRVFSLITQQPDGEISLEHLQQAMGEYGKIGQNIAFKNKWITKVPESGKFKNLVSSIGEDFTQICLTKIKERGVLTEAEKQLLKELKKRKLVEVKKIVSYSVKKGQKFTLKVPKLATDLTSEMILSGKWKELEFKPYNLVTSELMPQSGNLHPLMKVREEFKKIFLEMGFEEMPTNNYVESSFWNFDALFQPQNHPSRESQDTFFLENPKTSCRYPKEYMESVKEMHTSGGFGSIGYRYQWKEDDAKKNILRTHTTAVSTRMLYKMAQNALKNGKIEPKKYFSIDKVFRNESMDATHLAEFHQIEGVIADYNLTLGDLIGVLSAFFQKLGCKKLRFKPAYNPYTEPSMEVFSFHEGLGRWIEIGNSGIFRPEMLRPMGFDENLSVIAWGLSLERPTMIKYNISNIRDLVGHKVDLHMIQNNPICRLDK
jgi:phenylalanyl-tRNA synthetase alpha chain